MPREEVDPELPGHLRKDLASVDGTLWTSVQIFLRKHGKMVKPKLSAEQLGQLTECFNLMDQDGSGAIDVDELGAALKLLGINLKPSEVQQLVNEVDFDGTGELEIDEFLSIMTTTMQRVAEEGANGRGNSNPVPFGLVATAYRRKRLMEGIMSSDKVFLRTIQHMSEQQVQDVMAAQAKEAEELAHPKPAPASDTKLKASVFGKDRIRRLSNLKIDESVIASFPPKEQEAIMRVIGSRSAAAFERSAPAFESSSGGGGGGGGRHSCGYSPAGGPNGTGGGGSGGGGGVPVTVTYRRSYGSTPDIAATRPAGWEQPGGNGAGAGAAAAEPGPSSRHPSYCTPGSSPLSPVKLAPLGLSSSSRSVSVGRVGTAGGLQVGTLTGTGPPSTPGTPPGHYCYSHTHQVLMRESPHTFDLRFSKPTVKLPQHYTSSPSRCASPAPGGGHTSPRNSHSRGGPASAASPQAGAGPAQSSPTQQRAVSSGLATAAAADAAQFQVSGLGVSPRGGAAAASAAPRPEPSSPQPLLHPPHAVSSALGMGRAMLTQGSLAGVRSAAATPVAPSPLPPDLMAVGYGSGSAGAAQTLPPLSRNVSSSRV